KNNSPLRDSDHPTISTIALLTATMFDVTVADNTAEKSFFRVGNFTLWRQHGRLRTEKVTVPARADLPSRERFYPMVLQSLRGLFSRLARSRKRPVRRASRTHFRTRPVCEALEDRILLANSVSLPLQNLQFRLRDTTKDFTVLGGVYTTTLPVVIGLAKG